MQQKRFIIGLIHTAQWQLGNAVYRPLVRCVLPWGSGGIAGRTTTPFECEWLEPCPSPHLQPGSASTASSRPRLCDRGRELVSFQPLPLREQTFISFSLTQTMSQNRLIPLKVTACLSSAENNSVQCTKEDGHSWKIYSELGLEFCSRLVNLNNKIMLSSSNWIITASSII